MVKLSIDIKNITKVRQKLKEKGNRNAINQIVRSTVEDGYTYAYKIAPHDTGATRRALQRIHRQNESVLRLYEPKQQRSVPRPYHHWLHGFGKYDLSPFTKTGVKRFMLVARNYMQDDINRKLVKFINK